MLFYNLVYLVFLPASLHTYDPSVAFACDSEAYLIAIESRPMDK